MKCNLIKLQKFLEKELCPKESMRIEAHLRECTHCQEKVHFLKQTDSLLKSLTEVEVPTNFTEKIMQQLPELKKTKLNLAIQVLLALLLSFGIILSYLFIPPQFTKELAETIVLMLYLTTRDLFELIKFIFHPLVLLNLHFLKHFLPLIIKTIFYETVMLLSIFLIWGALKIKRRV